MDDTTKHRLEFLCNEIHDSLSTVHKFLDGRSRRASAISLKSEYTPPISVINRAVNLVGDIEDINRGGRGGFCSICEEYTGAAEECYTDDNGLLRCTNKEWM